LWDAQYEAEKGFLIVGVHNDMIVNRYRGSNMPIMNLHERVLSVLGCKYVDDVLIDAPYVMTEYVPQGKSKISHWREVGRLASRISARQKLAHMSFRLQMIAPLPYTDLLCAPFVCACPGR
jgi:hypothetical protein